MTDSQGSTCLLLTRHGPVIYCLNLLMVSVVLYMSLSRGSSVVEQLIRNQQVGSSILLPGSIRTKGLA